MVGAQRNAQNMFAEKFVELGSSRYTLKFTGWCCRFSKQSMCWDILFPDAYLPLTATATHELNVCHAIAPNWSYLKPACTYLYFSSWNQWIAWKNLRELCSRGAEAAYNSCFYHEPTHIQPPKIRWGIPSTFGYEMDILGSVTGQPQMVINTGWWFGTWMDYDFPFSWECHHPNWRTHFMIFQRGRLNHRLDISSIYLASTIEFTQCQLKLSKFCHLYRENDDKPLAFGYFLWLSQVVPSGGLQSTSVMGQAPWQGWSAKLTRQKKSFCIVAVASQVSESNNIQWIYYRNGMFFFDRFHPIQYGGWSLIHYIIFGWWFGTLLDFSIYWECHHPHWLCIFQRGRYTN